jgi:hypothetical protein
MAALSILTIVGILGAWAMNFSDEDVIEDFFRQHSGDVEIVISIRSTDGKPLKRVNVNLTTSDLSDPMGNNYDPDRFVVDSEFRIEERNVSAVHLVFFKDGFYSERWEYVMSERPPESWGRTHEIDVEIIMTPHPTPVPLEKFEGGLRADRDGPLSVLYPTKNRLPDRKASNHEVSVLPDENVSFPFLYLVADVRSDGRLATTPFQFKSISVPKPALSRGLIRIAGRSEGDGFLSVDIGRVPSIFEHGFRHLQRAPENCYSEFLELLPVEGNEKLFFYCRIGGRFGKGVVSNPPMVFDRKGVETAFALTTIYLNPTGSTDVSYLHH